MGYRGKRKYTHEYAKLFRQGITLDVHQHFPVAIYPDEIKTKTITQMAAAQNQGHWHLGDDPPNLAVGDKAIEWAELVKGADWGKAKGTEEVWFPSPVLLCLIHCVHSFRTATRRLHYFHPYGGFRLHELLAIRDLTTHHTFDNLQFQHLVEYFNAHESIAFINALSNELLGSGILPNDALGIESSIHGVFPENLVYGGWVSLQQIDDWLLLRRVEDFMHLLGATVLPAISNVETRTAPRLLTYGQSPFLSLSIEIIWDEATYSLTVDWRFAEDDHPYADYDFMIHFGYASFVQARLLADGSLGEVKQQTDYLRGDQQPIVEVVEHGGDFTVHMACHIPAFPAVPDAPASKSLPLFLAARSLRPDSLQTESACYLPLILQNA